MISKEEWPGRHQSGMIKMGEALAAFERGFVAVRALTPEQERVGVSYFGLAPKEPEPDEKVERLECSPHMIVTRWCETPEEAADEFCAALAFPYPSLKHLFDLYWRRMPQLDREDDFETGGQKFRASARYVVAVHKVYA